MRPIETLGPENVLPERYKSVCRDCPQWDASDDYALIRLWAIAHVRGSRHTMDLYDTQA